MIKQSAESTGSISRSLDGVRILIVEARFYSELADELLRGACQALDAFGATYDVVTVPGATVIRGETYHFEIVSNESARGIMDLTVRNHLAIGNGVLTVEDEEQAWARARVSEGDKGGGAARAALTMISMKQQFLGVRS